MWRALVTVGVVGIFAACGSDDSSSSSSGGTGSGGTSSGGTSSGGTSSGGTSSGGTSSGGTSSGGASGAAGSGGGGAGGTSSGGTSAGGGSAGSGGSSTGGSGGSSTGGSGGSSTGGSGGSGGTGGTGTVIPPQGNVDVTSCVNVDGIAEKCSFRYAFDAQKCKVGAACDKLVAFWAGGDQSCSLYTNIVDAFSAAGYVATCVQLFQTSTGSGAEPYLAEAKRVDLTLKGVTDWAKQNGVWSGKDLLLSGVSHGATSPVIAMARTTLDDGAHWKGSHKTGACFYDGIYSIGAIDALLGTGNAGSPCTFPVSHARIVGRYYTSDPLIHSCVNSKCWCDPQHAATMDQDTITGVGAANYAVKQWKLIECGSAMDTCASDIVPKAPIDLVCGILDASPNHTCVLDPMPNSGHITCAGAGTQKCISWFDAAPAG